MKSARHSHAHSVRTIGDLCEFESGRGFGPKDWKKSGLPIIRIQNLNGSKAFNYFDGPADPAWIVEPNDLLFAWAGVKGVSFGPTIWNGDKGVLNQHIYRVRPKRGVNKLWLYYALQQVTKKIESKAHGFKTSLVHVRKADITSAAVATPAPEEQARTANQIETWDVGLAKAQELIFTKQKYYFHHLSKTLCHTQHPRIRLNEVAAEVITRNLASNFDRVLSVTNSVGFALPQDQFERRVASQDLSSYKVVQQGEFAYNPSRINVGSIARLDDWEKGVLSPMYVVFKIDEGRLNSDYFLHWLSSHEARERIKRSAQGSVRESVSFNDFSALTIPVPSLAKQATISKFLNATRRESDLLNAYLEMLEQQKQGLVHKLFAADPSNEEPDL